MRKTIFLLFVALGAAVGLLATVEETWGVRILMTAIGTVAGVAIGGALSRVGLQRGPTRRPGVYRAFPSPMYGEDLDNNFWRDKGYPPFTKPQPEPDRHMFDPDRLE